jgi:hypothetical protein
MRPEPKIVFVQGPPGSGKDAFGALLAEQIPGAHVEKFARILKDRTHALYGLFDNYGFLSHDAFDATKDQVMIDFGGLTPRQAYIEVAEHHFKRLHGHRIFGEMLYRDLIARHGCGILKSDDVFIITDSGFVQEADVLVEHFGHDRCIALQMHRTGKTFEGDSRGYWSLGRANTFEIRNNGSLDDLKVIAASNAKFFFPSLGEISHEPSSCHAPRFGSDR